MKADAFLQAIGRAFKGREADARAADGAGSWTSFVAGRLMAFADAEDLHVCSEALRKRKFTSSQHMPTEYLWDFTFYRHAQWKPNKLWVLPDIIVEHENDYDETEFFADFWKVLAGFASLRVMIGYARDSDRVEERANAIRRHADLSAWTYPAGTEDVVLLGHYQMPFPKWRILVRRDGQTWLDLGLQELDGSSLKV